MDETCTLCHCSGFVSPRETVGTCNCKTMEAQDSNDSQVSTILPKCSPLERHWCASSTFRMGKIVSIIGRTSPEASKGTTVRENPSIIAAFSSRDWLRKNRSDDPQPLHQDLGRIDLPGTPRPMSPIKTKRPLVLRISRSAFQVRSTDPVQYDIDSLTCGQFQDPRSKIFFLVVDGGEDPEILYSTDLFQAPCRRDNFAPVDLASWIAAVQVLQWC